MSDITLGERAPTPLRGYSDPVRVRQANPGDPIRFTASTEGVKRDGLDLRLDGLDITAYLQNPVFLWAHDYAGRTLPIGRTVNLEKRDGALVVDVVFDQSDDFARRVERKYRDGYLNAVSIGWIITEMERSDEAIVVTRADLLDVSAVPVPGDPAALMEREAAALRSWAETVLTEVAPLPDDPTTPPHAATGRGAIPPHSTPLAPEDEPWSAAEELRKAEGAAKLRQMHAWVDDEQDPETKQAYKLPHHRGDSPHAVWRGVAAAMARLLQPRTGIPDEDRRRVYDHLARHYRQFGKTPPEFRSVMELDTLTVVERAGLCLEGEWTIYVEATMDETRAAAARLRDLLTEWLDATSEDSDTDTRSGDETITIFEAIRDHLASTTGGT